MVRLSAFALFVVVLSGGPVRPDGKNDSLQRDLANLKGVWVSAPVKDGDKEFRRHLHLTKGEGLAVQRQPGNTIEEFKELVLLSSLIEKDKKRYLKIVGIMHPNEYWVEYELTGDKLKLKGSPGGIDVSGEWTRHKAKEKEPK